MKRHYINTVILFLSIISLSSCQNKIAMNEAHYGTGASCSPAYPITLYAGVFYAPNDEFVLINERNLNGPWGAAGSSYAVGDGFEPIPDRLKVGFYSDAEDAFFEGEFPLPYDKLVEMFSAPSEDPFLKGKSFPDTQSGKDLKYMKYDALNVGISLGGLVVVWISGNGIQTEIGKFYAKETPKKWEDVFDNGSRQDTKEYNIKSVFSEKVKKEIATNSLPKKLWETYFEKKEWNYKIDFKAASVIESVFYKGLNSEAETIYGNNPQVNKDAPEKRPIPYNFEIIWTSGGSKFKGRVIFASDQKYYENIYNSGGVEKMPEDLNAILSYGAFQKINASQPATFLFAINKDNTDLEIFLQQGDSRIKIENCIVEVFNAD